MALHVSRCTSRCRPTAREALCLFTLSPQGSLTQHKRSESTMWKWEGEQARRGPQGLELEGCAMPMLRGIPGKLSLDERTLGCLASAACQASIFLH